MDKSRSEAKPARAHERATTFSTESAVTKESRQDAALSQSEKLLIKENILQHVREYPPVITRQKKGFISSVIGAAKNVLAALIRGKDL